MLITPRTRVGGIDRQQSDTVAVGLPAQATAEHRGRDPGDGSAEAFAARSSAHRFPAVGAGVGEVKVFHRDGVDAVAGGVVESLSAA